MPTRHFRLKLIGPLIAVATAVLIGTASFPYYGIRQIDAQTRSQQETLVKRNISIWIKDVEFSLTAWTIWDEPIAKIDNQFDFEWTDRNIGQSLLGTSRTRFAAVLDADDRLIYSRTADGVKQHQFCSRSSQAIVDDAAPLIAQVRSREGARIKKAGIPDPVTVSRIETRNGEAVLYSVSLFQPDFRTSRPKGARAPILVAVMPIDGSLEEFFGNRFLLRDARVEPLSMLASGRAHAEVATGAAGETEVLSWQPSTPAMDALLRSLPLIVTIVLVLLGGGYLAISVSREALRSLMFREQEMRHAATHDHLTGLANRKLFEVELRRQATSDTLTVVCIDLDGFKAVNDTHGHAAGDIVLSVVAERLRSATRASDIVFRLGGDEFAILMPGLCTAEAERTCQRVSEELSKPIRLPLGDVIIGGSFGLSAAGTVNGPVDRALSAADTALYQAKALGRGAVVLAA